MSDIKINFTFVDRLIEHRNSLQGGKRGAPKKAEDGARLGQELNMASIVMLSAALQAFIEDVYEDCLKKKMNLSDEECDISRKAWERWGNPNHDNIKRLFQNLGVKNIFEGLSWQGANEKTIKDNLKKLNEKRNKVAHGKDENIRINEVKNLRKFLENFSNKFHRHCKEKLNIK